MQVGCASFDCQVAMRNDVVGAGLPLWCDKKIQVVHFAPHLNQYQDYFIYAEPNNLTKVSLHHMGGNQEDIVYN